MTDSNPTPRDSHADFPNTSWTLLRHAQQGITSAQMDAMNLLAALYWRPLYAYYRAKGLPTQEAEDLVQEFFCSLTLEDQLTQVTPGVRFRYWLMACARNRLISHLRAQGAAVRSPPGGLRSLDELQRSGARFEPSARMTPEEAYRVAWRMDVLQRALESVRQLANGKNRQADLEVFLAYYAPQPGRKPTWEQLAAHYDLPHFKKAKNRADWASRQLQAAVREEIRRYVDCDEEVDDELGELFR